MCPCFRLLLPKGTLFSEEGPEIRSVVVADVRAMEGWLPDNVELAGGGLACVGPGEDGATYLASSLLDPSAKAQQPEHTDFSPPLWDWDADGVRGTSARMEQLCIHALLVQLYLPQLVSEGEIPPAPSAKGFGGRASGASRPVEHSLRRPVWLGGARGRCMWGSAERASLLFGSAQGDELDRFATQFDLIEKKQQPTCTLDIRRERL
jgi:hypothetical protein